MGTPKRVPLILGNPQVFDYFFDTVFGDSCALMFYPSFMHGFCQTSNEDVTPFGAGKAGSSQKHVKLLP